MLLDLVTRMSEGIGSRLKASRTIERDIEEFEVGEEEEIV
jgi:hypothetical protein